MRAARPMTVATDTKKPSSQNTVYVQIHDCRHSLNHIQYHQHRKATPLSCCASLVTSILLLWCLEDVRLGDLSALALESIVEAVDTQGSRVVDAEVHVHIDATGDLRSDDPDALMPCRVSILSEQRGLVIAVDNVHESLLDMVVSVGDNSINGV